MAGLQAISSDRALTHGAVRLVEANEALVKARNAVDASTSVNTVISQLVIWQCRKEKQDMLLKNKKDMNECGVLRT